MNKDEFVVQLENQLKRLQVIKDRLRAKKIMPISSGERDVVIEQALNIIFRSDRRMPAHFTSNGDRSQSFCIDFELLTKDDDEDMSSQAWGIIGEYITDASLLKNEFNIIQKFGEDVMIGGYVFKKLGGSNMDELKKAIFGDYIQKLSLAYNDLEGLLARSDSLKYFDFCCAYGTKIASR